MAFYGHSVLHSQIDFRPGIDQLGQILIAPFGRVRFRDFFLADILTSLPSVIAGTIILYLISTLNS
jgi:hypothetical protein